MGYDPSKKITQNNQYNTSTNFQFVKHHRDSSMPYISIGMQMGEAQENSIQSTQR